MKLEKILKTIKKEGGKTFFVGGCVRDKILGVESKDIDIEIFGIKPTQLEKILKDLKVNFEEAGVLFSVFKIRVEEGDIDLSFPRSEKSTGDKHTDFEIVVDPFITPKEATLRRDLTIGALMEDTETGEILDFHGGLKDLKEGIIKHTSDKFIEDSLRVFRVAQFASRFKFKVAEETRELSRSIRVEMLSKERVLEEFKKAVLKSEKPSRFFEELKYMEHLKEFFKELDELSDKDFQITMDRIDEAKKLIKDKTLLLSEIIALIKSKDLTEDKQLKMLQTLISMSGLETFPKSEEEVFTLILKSKFDLFIHLEIISETHDEKVLIHQTRDKFIKLSKDFIKGKDLIEEGFKPGPIFKELLFKTSLSILLGSTKSEEIKKLKK